MKAAGAARHHARRAGHVGRLQLVTAPRAPSRRQRSPSRPQPSRPRRFLSQRRRLPRPRRPSPRRRPPRPHRPTTTTTTTPTPSTTAAPAAVTYRFPVENVAGAGYAAEHHDYPAADIFEGCGAFVVAPVDGTLLEVRREDAWSPQTDNPAARGGRSVSLLGRDGVRYYFAHFQSIEASLEPGSAVTTGQRLGAMGRTGRASGCHLHFAISPPCPGKEWSVRRGVIAPVVLPRRVATGRAAEPCGRGGGLVARPSRRLPGGDGRPQRSIRLTPGTARALAAFLL